MDKTLKNDKKEMILKIGVAYERKKLVCAFLDTHSKDIKILKFNSVEELKISLIGFKHFKIFINSELWYIDDLKSELYKYVSEFKASAPIIGFSKLSIESQAIYWMMQ